MGEEQNHASSKVDFDRSVKICFVGAKVSSDAGLLAYRELDERLGLTEMAAEDLWDMRWGKNIQHSMLGLVRQSVYGRIAGHEDTDDADYLRHDPTMREVVGRMDGDKRAVSSSQMARWETEFLTGTRNFHALRGLPGARVQRVQRQDPIDRIVLDMDRSGSPTSGNQEGTAYSGHLGAECYHPLFCFNQCGDLEGAILRPGNIHNAEDWEVMLEPIVERYRHMDIERLFRGDAAFARPERYGFLEKEDFLYAIRLPANQVLYRHVKNLTEAAPRWPRTTRQVRCKSFRYRAGSWDVARRVVAKVEWRAGGLFPRVGFIVTNLRRWSKNVVRFYNQRGTAEQWIKEGKNAVKWTRLSCHRFIDNAVRLQLFALAYNLANSLRRLALPEPVSHWSLTTLWEKLVKVGAKVVRHARYVVFPMAEVAVPRELFGAILRRIQRLSPAPT
ncbi:MAG: IS1380 family transposase [Candidatus Brocadiia bacterium]